MNNFDSPLMLGFENLDNLLNDLAKKVNHFPPYNIIQMNNQEIKIEIAVAGYQLENLNVIKENNKLIIKGFQEDVYTKYIHKGIATRSFIKSFVLASGVEIQEAFLENGILNILLKCPILDSQAKKVSITNKNQKKQVKITK